jgi:hypothetical protein
MHFKLIPQLMIIILLGCCVAACQKPPSSDDNFLPADMKTFLVTDPCDACSFLARSFSSSETEKVVIRGIKHPSLGQTFFVNLDHERKVIKLRPVKDMTEVFILYDPYNSASTGLEVSSQYEQAKCPCGGNRFNLALALRYSQKTNPDDFSRIILAGKCTLCGEERILFQN